MTASALYEGTIRHRRFAERPREFRHRLALAYVDLEGLPRLVGGRLVARRPGIVRFRRQDYLGDPAVGLPEAVRALVARRTGAVLRGEFGKALRVSPFMGMEQRYELRVGVPGPTLSVHIESTEAGRRAFDATLRLERRALTARSLTGVIARYPAATLRVLGLIYGHAAALRLRGVGWRAHPQSVAS